MKKDIGKWLILFGVCLACFALIRLLIGVRNVNLILDFMGLGIFLMIIGIILLVITQIRKKSEGINNQKPTSRNFKKFILSSGDYSIPFRALIAALILIAYFIWKKCS
jgi:hypothetical protein